MPDVIILCEYPSLNGGEYSMLATLSGLKAAGVRVAVACPPHGPLADALAGRGVKRLPLELHLCRRRLPLPECRRRLAELLHQHPVDLLHANSLSMSRISGPVARQASIPSVGHLRDIVSLSASARQALNQHDRLLAVSEATRNWHVAQGLDAARIQVLYNGVDLHRFRPKAATGFLHHQLGLPRAVPLVGCIGQISIRKGLDVMLQAWRQVIGCLPQAHLVLAGERHSQKAEVLELEEQLQCAARQAPLAGRLHLLGVRRDVPDLLSELLLLAHAARQEPLGRVLLEAAACGVPVVATDSGGTREIFPDGNPAARLVAAGDACGLAEAIIEVVQDPAARRRMAAAARQRAVQAFDAQRASKALARHYWQLLGR